MVSIGPAIAVRLAFFLISFVSVSCGRFTSNETSKAWVTSETWSERGMNSSGSSNSNVLEIEVNHAFRGYLSLQETLNCQSFRNFDFILRSAELVGEWCRAQNKILEENGCGMESDFCVDTLIDSEMTQRRMIFGVAASVVNAVGESRGETTHLPFDGNYFWSSALPVVPIIPVGSNSWQSKSIAVTLSVGLDFVVSKKIIKRHTCSNPLASPFVEAMAKRELEKSQMIQNFDRSCE